MATFAAVAERIGDESRNAKDGALVAGGSIGEPCGVGEQRGHQGAASRRGSDEASGERRSSRNVYTGGWLPNRKGRQGMAGRI